MDYHVAVVGATSELLYGDVLRTDAVGVLFQQQRSTGRGYEHRLYPWSAVLAYCSTSENGNSWIVVASLQGEATSFLATSFVAGPHGLIQCETSEGTVFVAQTALQAAARLKRPTVTEAVRVDEKIPTQTNLNRVGARTVRQRAPGSNEDF